EFRDVHRQLLPEQRDDDGQPHGRFRRRHGHDAKDEDLSSDIPHRLAESDERHTYRVQHQPAGHQDDDRVAAQQYAKHPDHKEDRAERQVPDQCDVHYTNRLLANITAPMVATSSRTPITSSGSAYLVNSSRPMASADPDSAVTSSDAGS